MDLVDVLSSHKKWLRDDGGEKADLRGADLRGADLSGANLSDADVRGADLRGADLRDADLSDADWSGAYLSGADLRDANLSGAYLSGADLRGADLRDADLSGANVKIFQSGLWTAYITDTHCAIGCQRHSLEGWLNFSDAEIRDMHEHALDYWNENKEIIFAIAASIKIKEKTQ